MKTILAVLALATVSAFGLASNADAAPISPVATHVALDGGWRVGIGISTGGGYAQPSGYYTTEYRWVPTTVFAGYDAWNRPVYTTQYVQQAFQVWVPAVRYAAPSYGYSNFGYGYSRPRVSFGFEAGRFSGGSRFGGYGRGFDRR